MTSVIKHGMIQFVHSPWAELLFNVVNISPKYTLVSLSLPVCVSTVQTPVYKTSARIVLVSEMGGRVS